MTSAFVVLPLVHVIPSKKFFTAFLRICLLCQIEQTMFYKRQQFACGTDTSSYCQRRIYTISLGKNISEPAR